MMHCFLLYPIVLSLSSLSPLFASALSLPNPATLNLATNYSSDASNLTTNSTSIIAPVLPILPWVHRFSRGNIEVVVDYGFQKTPLQLSALGPFFTAVSTEISQGMGPGARDRDAFYPPNDKKMQIFSAGTRSASIYIKNKDINREFTWQELALVVGALENDMVNKQNAFECEFKFFNHYGKLGKGTIKNLAASGSYGLSHHSRTRWSFHCYLGTGIDVSLGIAYFPECSLQVILREDLGMARVYRITLVKNHRKSHSTIRRYQLRFMIHYCVAAKLCEVR